MQSGEEAMLSISPAGRGQLHVVKTLITLEQHGIYTRDDVYAGTRRSFVIHFEVSMFK